MFIRWKQRRVQAHSGRQWSVDRDGDDISLTAFRYVSRRRTLTDYLPRDQAEALRDNLTDALSNENTADVLDGESTTRESR